MESWCENLPRKLLNRLGCCRYPCIHSKSCIAMASYHSPFTKSPILYSPHTHRTFPQTLLQASTSSPRHPHSTATHCDATSALNCAPAHRPRITPPRPAPHALELPRSWALPRRSHHHYHPRHRHCRRGLYQRGPVHFSPWDGDNVPPEVPKVQECTVGPCRRVWAVRAHLNFYFTFVIIMSLFCNIFCV
jgi:hypothetical protein